MDQPPFSSLTSKNTPLHSANAGFRLHDVIIGSSELAIISTDLAGTITSFNKAAEDLVGYKATEVIAEKPITIFYQDEELTAQADKVSNETGKSFYPGIDAMTAKVRGKFQSERQEWNYLHRNGSKFPVIVSITSLWEGEIHLGYCVIATGVSDQIIYRKQLEESETQLKALVSSIDDIVFELDAEGRFNKIWVKSDDFLFLPRENIYGRTLSEMFGKEFCAPFDEGFKNVVATGEPFTWEYRSPAQDDRWFLAKTAAIFDRGVKTDRISVCIQDITDRKKVELSLRESEEKFRLLAQNIPGAVYLMKNDPENTIVYLNDEIENLTGYSAQEFFSGKVSLRNLIHDEDRLYVKNLREKSLEDNVNYQLEYRLLHQSGQWRWVSDAGMGVYSGDKIGFLEGCITDISSRKASEEEMRRMADENSRIFNNTLTLAALATFDGYFKRLNPAWEKTLGWTRDELMAKPFISFIHPDDLETTEEILRVVSSGNTVPTFENRYRCKDGSYRWLLWSSSPDIARKIIYASAIDITSRKKSEEELLMSKRNLEVAAFELEEQNRQLDEFAHIISHNLRAPVNNIKALLNFINDSSRITDYQLIFEKIKNVTFNISETMNELLETIRIKKNYEIERVEIRFKDVLDKVIQSLEGDLIESGATVTYNFNNAPKIYYSKTYLESILQNLISNAIKYRSMERIPEIFVSTDLVKNGIEMRVQDNGLGIDMKQYGHKLFGLHKTFHENKEARGVGLFLTKTQIETLGGSIAAESEVDKGTTFIIQF